MKLTDSSFVKSFGRKSSTSPSPVTVFRAFGLRIFDFFRPSNLGFRILVPTSLLVVGCKVGPNYRVPETSVPQGYHAQLVVTNQSAQTLSQWWRLFHDPQLDQLVQQANVANL